MGRSGHPSTRFSVPETVTSLLFGRILAYLTKELGWRERDPYYEQRPNGPPLYAALAHGG